MTVVSLRAGDLLVEERGRPWNGMRSGLRSKRCRVEMLILAHGAGIRRSVGTRASISALVVSIPGIVSQLKPGIAA